MPAHITAFDRLKIFGHVIKINLDRSHQGKMRRGARQDAKELRNKRAGTPDAANNRAAYFPMKYLTDTVETRVRKEREREFRSYSDLRGFLDTLNPAQAYKDGAKYTDQTEWDLYLQPGTDFDWRCRLFFDAQQGSMLVIMHRADRLKLKRIEAIADNRKPIILWTDAS